MKLKLLITLMICLQSLSLLAKPSIEEICSNTEKDIRKIEKSKNNLKKEFKQISSEERKMQILAEITKDVNELMDRQIRFSKLYHYLECSRYVK